MGVSVVFSRTHPAGRVALSVTLCSLLSFLSLSLGLLFVFYRAKRCSLGLTRRVSVTLCWLLSFLSVSLALLYVFGVAPSIARLAPPDDRGLLVAAAFSEKGPRCMLIGYRAKRCWLGLTR